MLSITISVLILLKSDVSNLAAVYLLMPIAAQFYPAFACKESFPDSVNMQYDVFSLSSAASRQCRVYESSL